jgi:hypothetical protein
MILTPGNRQESRRNANNIQRMLREGDREGYIRAMRERDRPWSRAPGPLNKMFSESNLSKASQHARDVYDMRKRHAQEARALMVGKTTSRTVPGFLGKQPGALLPRLISKL